MRKSRLSASILSIIVLLFTFSHVDAQQEDDLRKLAIVIDDFGNDMKGTKEILQLPIPLTVAVMPFLPTTKRDAEWAYQLNHDVLVHLPMEPYRGKKSWLGPGAISTDLSDEEIRKRVNAAIDDVPHAIGVNNHMGSKATADPRTMRIVLEVCQERGLIFLDSHTNYRSVVSKLASEMQVPFIENHIFLDDSPTIEHINRQITEIEKHLEKEEACIAIGHVGVKGKKTATALNMNIPKLKKKISFVKASELLWDFSHNQVKK